MKRGRFHLRATIILGIILCSASLLFLNLEPKNLDFYANESQVETCVQCHEELVQTFRKSTLSSIFHDECSSCHGEVEEHLEKGEVGTIFAFKATDLPTQKSNRCLTCHPEKKSRFPHSPHAKSSLDCTSCHLIHGEKQRAFFLNSSSTNTCLTCHEDIFSEFRLNERHRLEEGILTCSDCHDPHESQTRTQLGGFKHESCLRCHRDKGGPFLYEHGASRIEGCLSCHEVHGTPNRHLLTHQSVADLCFSCHGQAPFWHSRFDSYSTNCTLCHSTIHGSNLSKIFLK